MQNKKKIISVILALIIALSAWSVVPFTANAVEAEVASTGALYQDDPDFNYMVDLGDIAEITEYKGKGGDVTIPSTLGRFTVTSIGMNAFSNCTSLTSVTIPDSVTNIDIGAFSDCTGLKSVTIGNSVTSIGLLAFSDCNGLTNVTIPDSVTTIDDMAFEGCTGLTSVIFGNSVTSIGDGAFEDCTGLTSIDIPDSVTSIGSSAFSGCTSLTNIDIPDSIGYISMRQFAGCTGLTSITIPDSVTSIGDSAFEDCTGLTSVAIGNSVTSIGYCAFCNCTGLTNLTIPDSVTTIGEKAFSGCTGLTSIKVAEGNTVYDSRDNCNAIIETESNTLIYGLKNTIIPNSVTSIEAWAFYNCMGLTSIDIPDSVTSISGYAFYDCTELTSVTIGSSVSDIRGFQGCTSLTSIKVAEGNTVYDSRDNCNAIIETESNKLIFGCKGTVIPDSVTSISDYAFYGCTELTSVTIPDSVTSIGNHAFGFIYDREFEGEHKIDGFTIYGYTGSASEKYANDNRFTFVSIGESTQYESTPDEATPDEAAASFEYTVQENGTAEIIGYKGKGGDVTIPSTLGGYTVTSIGKYAFEFCESLTRIDIPESVTSIGWYAFSGCTSLTSISIPDSVMSIGGFAFSDCAGLTNIVIPDSVTSIGDYAFEGCTGMKSVTIPDSVTSIGGLAFGYNYSVQYRDGMPYITYTSEIDGFTIYGYEGSEAEKYTMRGKNEIPFIPLKDKDDTTTGIILAVPEDTDLTVKDITSDISSKLPGNFNVLTAYDISLTKDGETVQPENIVPVKIPCTNENAKVFRLEADGTMTDMNAKYKDGYMVFTTDHFSVYVLAEPNVKTGVTVSGTITSYVDDANVTIKLTGVDNNFTAEVKGKSEYSIADVPAGKYTLTVSKDNHVAREYTVTVTDADVTQDVKICPKGDVNGDGETDIMDCSLAQRYIRELTTLDAYQIACGDVSGEGDGELDIQDVSRILRHIRELAMLY